ncbi:hypothetical protein [Sporosarcina sp. A2]|uniref:hypothetical protein n=1 Tax=Sporosarcina sp. A2 TaxID=3393449 RepID=UPI003D78C133
MTNLQTVLDKMYEIEKSTTSIAHEFKNAVAEKQSELKYDTMLSPAGRDAKLKEFKSKKGAEFVKKAATMRAEYDKAAVQAQVAAEQLLNDPANKPSDLVVQSFTRQLAEFQTGLMLSTNPDSALQLAKDFAGKTNDPYLVGKLKEVLPQIVSEVTGLAGTKAPEYKVQLQRLVAGLNEVAASPEIKQAQSVIEGGSKQGQDIWRSGGVQLDAIGQAVGKEYSRYANNPSAFEAEQDAE